MSLRTVLLVLGASLLVGLLMTALGVSAADVYEGAGRALVRAWAWTERLIKGQWGTAFLAGASVVVPAWLVIYLLRRRWRRGGRP